MASVIDVRAEIDSIEEAIAQLKEKLDELPAGTTEIEIDDEALCKAYGIISGEVEWL